MEADQAAQAKTDGDTDWVGAFFRDADSFRLEALTAWFADDIEVRFGNQPAISGKAAAEQSFKDFWSMIDGMSHRREAIVSEGDRAAQMSIVTYTCKDGRAVSMPVASHLRRSGEHKIDLLWIFIDMSPLFADE